MSRPLPAPRRLCPRPLRVALAALALGLATAPNFGCGREFFRQWADQDVSEAVFEKSRDPRWRLDLFSIEPPALARFADPYDVDRPPAPPDDHATEALAPTPQWPQYRLMMPLEGTGYLDQLAKGRRYDAPPPEPAEPNSEAPAYPATPPGAPPPPAPDGASPFIPPGNSGTGAPGMSPNSPSAPPSVPPTPSSSPPQARTSPKDKGVLLTAFQVPSPNPNPPAAPGLPVRPGDPQTSGTPSIPPAPTTPALPVNPAAPNTSDLVAPGGGPGTAPPRRPAGERIGGTQTDLDPQPNENANMGTGVRRGDLSPEERKAAVSGSAGFAALLTPGVLDFNEALASGYPADSRPYIVGPAEALQLALTNSRAYQYRLENLYLTSLTLTLSRFQFTPQFYAGLSPTTSPTFPRGTIVQSFPNSFAYRTKEAQGGQASTLSLGTAVGFGKLLSFGGTVAGGFANQMVFNFLAKNPRQPTVASYLPLNVVIPFLSGGGRAVTLEGLTQAERNLVYEARNLARFRQDFVPYILTSTNNVDITGGTGPNATDPNIGYLNVLLQLQDVENDRRTVAAYERVLKLYLEYVKGSASSGISQIQVDQVAQSLQARRQTLLSDELQYRQVIDQFKYQLGLPPDVQMILDRSPIGPFRDVFNKLEEWSARDDHDPADLPGIIDGLPKLETIVLDGRNLFEYRKTGDEVKLIPVYAEAERLQDFLLTCERIALENRLDLMNTRAQLYDAWRQIAVQANGLRGIFNVSLTNTYTTPPTTNNPFGFLDQAKQFNLILNTELPLIRVSQRNGFRQALITYRQQQRVLMNREDAIKYQVRSEVYNLIQLAETFELQKPNLFYTIRQRDNTLQSIIAPPASIDASGSNAANQATQTNNLITSITNILTIQNSLLQTWVSFQTQRLSLYRDLGLMPYDEWEAFYEFFPSNNAGGGQPAPRDGRSAGGGAALAPEAGR